MDNYSIQENVEALQLIPQQQPGVEEEQLDIQIMPIEDHADASATLERLKGCIGEEDWERVLLRQISEVTGRLSQCESYIVELKVLGPRLFVVEPLSYMIEIHTQKTDKLNQLREM
ncbi:hypothetical protein Tco_1139162 [Tanacetum coccineum]